MRQVSPEIWDSLCDKGGREWLASPFSAEALGKWWSVGTFGHALLAIETPHAEYRTQNAPPVSGLIRSDAPTHRVRLEALTEWADAAKWETECDWCKGTGKHTCNCSFCEIEKDEGCDECEGGLQPNREFVRFNDVTFDRALLARYLQPLRGKSGSVAVVFRGELEPIDFIGDDWRIVVMSAKSSPGDEHPTVIGLFEGA